MSTAFIRLDSILVILVCTLPGGVDQGLWEAVPLVNKTDRAFKPQFHGNRSCAAGGHAWRDCAELDASVHPMHLFAPWAVTLATVVCLSMPTIMLRSRAKARALRLVTGILVQYLCLLGCGVFMAARPAISFVFSLHATIRFLSSIENSPVMVGGTAWWALRYLAAGSILTGQMAFGPIVPVVYWPGITMESGVSCAYLCHLIGCVLPDVALSIVQCLVAFARCIPLRDD